MQEILQARRSGKSLNGVDERRKEVAKYMKLSKDEQRKFREKRSPAEPIYEEDPPWFGTSASARRRLREHAWPQLTLRRCRCVLAVIIPQAPFGMPKYDNGERWDLKAKYTDEGYEDAEADVMGKFMALFKPKAKGKDGEK